MSNAEMIARFQSAAEAVAVLGTPQERLGHALEQLLPLPDDLPANVRATFAPVEDALTSGAVPGDLCDEYAARAAQMVIQTAFYFLADTLLTRMEEQLATIAAKLESIPAAFAALRSERPPPQATKELQGAEFFTT